jgi:sulfite exporter TauE/SafE
MERVTSRLWWVLPALSVLLGALLGLVNLNSPEASGLLRVPALLAGLILVAQGLLDFENGRRAHAARLPTPETHLAALNPVAPPVVLNRDDVVVLENRQPSGGVVVEQAQAQALAASTAVRESRGAVVAVLALAVWLGLATLSYSNSPASLLRLSLLASFLLFASAWSMLQKRTA